MKRPNYRKIDNRISDLAMIGVLLAFAVPALLYFLDVIPGAGAVALWAAGLFLTGYLLSFVVFVVDLITKRNRRTDDDDPGFLGITILLLLLGVIGLVVYYYEPPECDGTREALKKQTFTHRYCDER